MWYVKDTFRRIVPFASSEDARPITGRPRTGELELAGTQRFLSEFLGFREHRFNYEKW